MGSFKHSLVGNEIVFVMGSEHEAQHSFMMMQKHLTKGVFANVIQNEIRVWAQHNKENTKTFIGINHVPKTVVSEKLPVDTSGPGNITRYIQYSEIKDCMEGKLLELRVQ